MAARPAKRQRRSLIVQSDDNASDEDVSERRPISSHGTSDQISKKRTNRTKPITPQKRTLRDTSAKSSPNSSPEKARKVARKVEAPNKSLHSFFGRATEEQRWKRKSATPEVDIQDQIEDDISDNEFDTSSSLKLTTNDNNFSNRPKQEVLSSSQKFVKSVLSRSLTSQSSVPELQDDTQEQKPWADRYGPENLEELAVHKKKVTDVQNWLKDVLAGRVRQRLLVLKGPAGSGKTSTVNLLAGQLGIKTVAWHNSTVSETGLATNIQQFGEFLSRGGGFESLSFQEGTSTPVNQESHHRLLLVEEFPTITNRASSTLNSFRTMILQYLASSSQNIQFGKPSMSSHPPMVMLISETLLSSSTALNDSFTAHRLLGTDISNHPCTTIVEFNPVAPTFVQKALDLVIKKEARDSKRRRSPGPAVLHKLAEIGDIRSAINTLEFLCARGDEDGDWSGTVAGRTKKKDNVPLTEMEKNTLQLVSQRESTLDMFHAAGKIVYNKREDPRVLDTRAEPPPKPPDHLLYLYTPKVSQVDIEALLSETGTDIQTFISTLHENYVLSCNGDDFADSLDGCASILSDSDILNPETRSLFRGRGNSNVTTNFTQSGNSDMLRQDEISFQTACRGLLFHLPFPVSRAVPLGARKQDAYKMFYPASLRLWKPAEEIYDLITAYVNIDLKPSHSGISSTSYGTGATNGVSSWRSRGFGIHTIPDDDQGSSQDDSSGMQSAPPTTKAVTSRDNYVLEILPYMTRIKAVNIQATTQTQTQTQTQNNQSQEMQNLKKITQLQGGINLTTLTNEEPDDNGLDNEPEGNTRMSFEQKIQAAHDSIRGHQQQQQQHQKNSNNSHTPSINPSSSFGSAQATNNNSQTANPSRMGSNDSHAAAAMDKLYISDDDISD